MSYFSQWSITSCGWLVIMADILCAFVMDRPVELGQSVVGERYSRGVSRNIFDELSLPDGELSHLLTRNPVLDDVASFDPRSK